VFSPSSPSWRKQGQLPSPIAANRKKINKEEKAFMKLAAERVEQRQREKQRGLHHHMQRKFPARQSPTRAASSPTRVASYSPQHSSHDSSSNNKNDRKKGASSRIESGDDSPRKRAKITTSKTDSADRTNHEDREVIVLEGESVHDAREKECDSDGVLEDGKKRVRFALDNLKDNKDQCQERNGIEGACDNPLPAAPVLSPNSTKSILRGGTHQLPAAPVLQNQKRNRERHTGSGNYQHGGGEDELSWKNRYLTLRSEFDKEMKERQETNGQVENRHLDQKAEIARLKKLVQESKQKCVSNQKDYEEKEQKLRKRCMDLRTQHESLVMRFETQKRDMEKVMTDYKALGAEKDALMEKCSKLATDLAMEIHHESLSQMEKENEKLKESLSLAETEKEKLKELHSLSEKESEKLKEKLSLAETEKEKQRKLQSLSEKEKEKLKESLSLVQTEKEKQMERQSLAEKQKEKLMESLSLAEREKGNLMESLSRLETEREEAVKCYRERLSRVGEEKKELMERYRESLSRLQTEKRDLSAKVKGLIKDKQIYAERLKASEFILSKNMKEARAKEEAHQKFRTETLQKHQKELEQARAASTNDTYTGSVTTTTTTTQWKEELQRKTEELEHKSRELTDKSKALTELQHNFNTIAMQSVRQSNTIEEQREEMRQLKAQIGGAEGGPLQPLKIED